ncbi:hypothetical protein ACQ4M4_12115 [Leptolyngbya sp. AN02str]|uniref:hypothetical protein n=1 Tax=Leptolyngbya sp. AN02str TaxID=3423363 RepID=UPI003D3186F2
MDVLTEDAVMVCDHELGRVKLEPTQTLVTINGRRVLVARNPEQRAIAGCPNVGPTIKPCTTTLAVKQGYSDLLRIEGKRVCLDTVKGLTDGTPPGAVNYSVRSPGQSWVQEVS